MNPNLGPATIKVGLLFAITGAAVTHPSQHYAGDTMRPANSRQAPPQPDPDVEFGGENLSEIVVLSTLTTALDEGVYLPYLQRPKPDSTKRVVFTLDDDFVPQAPRSNTLTS